MTVIINYFGHDLKKHEIELSDYVVSESLTYNWDMSVKSVLNCALSKISAAGIAEIYNVSYRDDE